MKDNAEILKLRVLLCFWKLSPADRSVTGIARTLGKEKYAVSRAVSSLEKDGLVQRENARSPQLTEAGRQAASRYSERFETALNHLLYEGVDLESAKQDAFVWTLYCTDSTMETVRANEGFEHPCSLYVKDGVGTVQLRAVPIAAKSRMSGETLRGRVGTLRYFDAGRFVCAEPNGQIFSFPAEVLQFVNVGSGVGQILHGSVCLQMESSVGAGHMPESTAIFTLLF